MNSLYKRQYSKEEIENNLIEASKNDEKAKNKNSHWLSPSFKYRMLNNQLSSTVPFI